MKERAEWLLKTAAVLLCGLSLILLMEQNGFATSAAGTLAYVVILYSAYRLGAAAGAASGIFCALFRLTEAGGTNSLLALPLAGALAGMFRHLGKNGSLTAFVCGMTLGALAKGPEMLIGSLYGLLGGGLIFLLLPEGRHRRLSTGILRETGKLSGQSGFAAGKLDAIREALQLLARYYQELPESGWEPGEAYSQAVTWYAGYLEEKLAASAGMEETARLINSLLREYEEMEDETGTWRAALRERLREKKVSLDDLLILRSPQGRLTVCLTVHAVRSRCIPARELAALIGDELGRAVKPDPDARAVIGRKPCTVRFQEDTGYHMMYEVVREAKEASEMSGDNFSCMRLPEGKAVLGLSDGMGTGKEAARDSETVMELAEKLLCAGYGEAASARLINAILIQKGNRRPVTLDLATVDLYTGNCCFTKLGAVTTFLRRGSEVEAIGAGALPAGVLTEAVPMTETRVLSSGDMIVMVTDGVLDALAPTDKEESMRTLLSGIRSDNPREIARQVLDFACESGGKRLDDMTVLAAGIWKK